MHMTKDISKRGRKAKPSSGNSPPKQPGFAEGGQEPLKPSKAMEKALEAVKNMDKKTVH